jgi:hypothetical protein
VTSHYFKFRNKEIKKIDKRIDEFYADLRDTKISKAYAMAFLFRRILMIFIILSYQVTPVLFR